MDRSTAILILAGLAALVYALDSGASMDEPAPQWADDPAPADPAAPVDSGADIGAAVPSGDRLSAMLAVIRKFESGDDYSVLFGGQRFSGFADHPRVRVPFVNPATGRADYSTAAGAYQFISTTWDDAARALGLPDFAPASQDRAAVWLLGRLGVPALLDAGDVPGAFAKASRAWASLPGSTARQNPKSIQVAMTAFNNALTGATA